MNASDIRGGGGVCRACGAVMEPWEIRWKRKQHAFEDLCTLCLQAVEEDLNDETFNKPKRIR